MRHPTLLHLTVFLVACTFVLGQVPSPDIGIPWLYKGLAVWAFAWGGLDAFSIGANDVANSFANAVGAKTITYAQACIIAVFCEFIGAVALGSNVTDTIRGKIVDVKRFTNDPYMLMLGMSTTSIGSSVWILGATFLGFPVSTTHATVGAVMGVGIAAFGVTGVNWEYESGGFTSIVASWFISPAVAGVLASIIYLSLKFFVLTKPDEISFRRGLQLLPPYAFLTFGIVTGFMIFKGIPLLKDFSGQYEKSIPTVIGVGMAFAILTFMTAVPWVRRFIQDNENLPWWTMFFILCVPVGKYGYYEEGTHDDIHNQRNKENKIAGDDDSSPNTGAALQMMSTGREPTPPQAYSPQPPSSMMSRPMYPPQQFPMGGPPIVNVLPGQPPVPYSNQYPLPGVQGQGYNFGQSYSIAGGNFGESKGPIEVLDEDRPRVNGVPMYYTTNDKWYDTLFRKISPGMYIDIDALCEECAPLHSHANHFYDKTERLYKVLNVSTSSFASIAHGANDIANAMGPLSAVWAIYSTGTLNSKSPVEAWILAYGAAMLDLGLILMGHNIMMVLGNKLTYQTPSRAFCMDIGAMFTVLIFSKLGVPVSTTHCITGATTGVGLCNGDAKALNWKMLFGIATGWIITCPAAGVITGLIFWGLATAPNPTPGNGFFGTELFPAPVE